MRAEYQANLRDFSVVLSALEKSSARFIERFVKENLDEYGRYLDPLLLFQYHQGVFAWLAKWGRQFHDELVHTSAFQADNVASDIGVCIERNRARLKLFIICHASVLPAGIMDVTLSPFMPAHRALLMAAEIVVSQEESICRLFFPNVKTIVGFPTGGTLTDSDLKFATETEGKFSANLFVSRGETTLISVVDYLDYVNTNNDVAKEYIADKSRQKYLYHLFGAPFNNYSKALIYLAMRRISDSSRFAFHVIQFAAALHEKSVERKGKEYDASAGYDDVILKFYRLWRTLKPDVKNPISKACLGEDERTFEDYLLSIFVTIPFSLLVSQGKLRQDEVLSKFNIDRERKNGMVRCCNVVSNVMSDFVSLNQQWGEIKVSQTVSDDESIYRASDLPELKEIFLSALNDERRKWKMLPKIRQALMPTDHNQHVYQRFFNLSDLIFIFSDAHLSFCLKNNFSDVFSNPSQVLFFIHENKGLTQSFWNLFPEKWAGLFGRVDDIATLLYLIKEKSVVLKAVLPLFESTLKTWFSSENVNADFLHKNCQYFRFSPVIIFDNFIKTIIELQPDYIADPQGLLKSIFFSRTEARLQNRFCLIRSHAIAVLSRESENAYGANLLNYIKLLSTHFKNKPSFYSVIIAAISECQISKLLLWKKIDALYTTCFSGCFSAFFGLKKTDSVLYARLSDINDDPLKTPFEKNKEMINMLSAFLREHQGKDTAFSRGIRNAFASDFFEGLDECLSSHLGQFNEFAALRFSFD